MFLWIKAIHLISVITLMAVIFYLPRLFVYHLENKEKKEFVEVIQIMERKLHKFIGIPSFWLVLLTGLGMLFINPTIFKSGGWIHAKITLAILMLIYYISLAVFLKKIQSGNCKLSSKFFRFYNEVPTVLLILIVILVIVRPF